MFHICVLMALCRVDPFDATFWHGRHTDIHTRCPDVRQHGAYHWSRDDQEPLHRKNITHMHPKISAPYTEDVLYSDYHTHLFLIWQGTPRLEVGSAIDQTSSATTELRRS